MAIFFFTSWTGLLGVLCIWSVFFYLARVLGANAHRWWSRVIIYYIMIALATFLVPQFEMVGWWGYPFCAALALVCGVAGWFDRRDELDLRALLGDASYDAMAEEHDSWRDWRKWVG